MKEQTREIHKYEDFLENVLQKDLERLIKYRDDSLVKIQEIQKLQRNVSLFREMKVSELSTRTNLGCDVYVDTLIPDATKICVELSFGFFLELNLDEVPRVLDLKQELEHE
ncbi:protein UXT [Cryptosporidium felis]|nr:protein UXT [Cryptosporidium felis]